MSRTASLRALVSDGGWVVAGIVFSIFGTRGADEIASGRRRIDGLGWTLVIVAPLVLLAARHRPRAAFAASAVIAAGYIARNYAGGPVYLVPVAAAAVLGWLVPLARSWQPIVAGGFLLVAVSIPNAGDEAVLTELVSHSSWLLVPFTPWALAALVRMKRTSERQAVAERERHERDEERVRLAREVHDVVGHSLAVISMQAGVALHVRERRPEHATVALEAIARSSQEALGELRRTLAALRGDRAASTAGPPDVRDVDALVADFAAGGLPVTLDVTGERPSRADVAAAAYRIVQESLTNVVRHAGAVAPARVRIEHGARAVVVEICDDGARATTDPGIGGGSGIAGMRERCVGLGGRFEAGPRPGGGWRVRAELPRESVS